MPDDKTIVRDSDQPSRISPAAAVDPPSSSLVVIRTERAFLKSERTKRLWSRGILETPVACATV